MNKQIYLLDCMYKGPAKSIPVCKKGRSSETQILGILGGFPVE